MIQELVQSAPARVDAELERLTYSAYLYSLTEETNSEAIFSLDSSSRTAFLLHHVLGYNMEEASVLLEVSEIEFRAQLRNAYLQLASDEFGSDVHLSEVAAEPALA